MHLERIRDEEARLAGKLAAMHSVLDTFGKPLDGAVLGLWLAALGSASVTPAEFDRACGWWLRNRREYPRPVDLIGWVLDHRMDDDTRRALEEASRDAARERETMGRDFRKRHGLEGASREQVMAKCREIFGVFEGKQWTI
ncbi:MAG: hypothetical protein ACO1SV_00905 [Fimbriimonas sp.]